MTRRKARGLTEEERALWQQVKDSVIPLNPDAPHPLADLPDGMGDPDPPKLAREVLPPFEPFRIGQKVADGALGHDRQTAMPPVNMDRRQFGKLKRGKLKPEARIDLHGMTLAQAHPALVRFVLNSQASGKRLVLVITGKGKLRDSGDPIPAQRSLLRTQVPQWLSMPPLSQAVLQVSEAHLRHGGGGAFYVYLRRIR